MIDFFLSKKLMCNEYPKSKSASFFPCHKDIDRSVDELDAHFHQFFWQDSSPVYRLTLPTQLYVTDGLKWIQLSTVNTDPYIERGLSTILNLFFFNSFTAFYISKDMFKVCKFWKKVKCSFSSCFTKQYEIYATIVWG